MGSHGVEMDPTGSDGFEMNTDSAAVRPPVFFLSRGGVKGGGQQHHSLPTADTGRVGQRPPQETLNYVRNKKCKCAIEAKLLRNAVW